MLRPADGAVAQPASTAPPGSPASIAPAGPTATPPTVLQAAPTPGQDQAALAPLTPQPSPATAPVRAQATEAPPAANPTPLMDAAIERVAAVTQQQRESLDSAQPPSESDDYAATAVAPASPVVIPTAPVQKPPPPLLMADIKEPSPEFAPTITKPIDAPTQAAIPNVPTDDAPRTGLEKPIKIDIFAGAESAAPTRESAGTLLDNTQPQDAIVPAATGDRDPLFIAKLCLCRKIVGFGSFEPFTEPHVKAGQVILLYCEITGMQCESKEASFVSRLSSKIEIGSVESGVFQWAIELGPKVDVCASRRHDFFVNYKFPVPSTLPPGSYRLHLTQTDLVANRSISAELPLVIVP
jgi:hypothetical protein